MQWSTKANIPVLVNVEKLQIVTSLDDPWFLQEFGFICGVMCPRLKVVSVRHSPCKVNHIIEPFEQESQIVPNETVRTLRLEGFDCEMNAIMGEFTKYFSNLTHHSQSVMGQRFRKFSIGTHWNILFLEARVRTGLKTMTASYSDLNLRRQCWS